MFVVIELFSPEAADECGMVSTVRKSRAGLLCPGAATESPMPGLYAMAVESEAVSSPVREPPWIAWLDLRRFLDRQRGHSDSPDAE